MNKYQIIIVIITIGCECFYFIIAKPVKLYSDLYPLMYLFFIHICCDVQLSILGYIIVVRPSDKKKFKKAGIVAADKTGFTMREKIKEGGEYFFR